MSNLKDLFGANSTVVLCYINNHSKKFQILVANRIHRIKSGTQPEQWTYIACKDNPANHASKGMTPEKLKTSN